MSYSSADFVEDITDTIDRLRLLTKVERISIVVADDSACTADAVVRCLRLIRPLKARNRALLTQLTVAYRELLAQGVDPACPDMKGIQKAIQRAKGTA